MGKPYHSHGHGIMEIACIGGTPSPSPLMRVHLSHRERQGPGERSAPARDFVAEEAMEAEGVLCVLRSFPLRSVGQRIHPVRDFVPNEATETEDVLCVPRGFGCAPMGRKIRPGERFRRIGAQWKRKVYFVYPEASIVHLCGERSAPARDFVPNEATETEDVLCVPRGFGCAPMGRKIRPGERFRRRGSNGSGRCTLCTPKLPLCTYAAKDPPGVIMKKLPPLKKGGRYFQRNQASLFSFRVRLLFLRAALFLCRRPFRAAWSTDLTATL